jgi:hypothetical protein
MLCHVLVEIGGSVGAEDGYKTLLGFPWLRVPGKDNQSFQWLGNTHTQHPINKPQQVS